MPFVKATVIGQAGHEYLVTSPCNSNDDLAWRIPLSNVCVNRHHPAHVGQTLALEVKVVGTDSGCHLVIPTVSTPSLNYGWLIPKKHLHAKLPPCGNHECAVSTGICESLTYGSGELDPNGYWEFPCNTCARAAELRHPESGSCWPFAEKTCKM